MNFQTVALIILVVSTTVQAKPKASIQVRPPVMSFEAGVNALLNNNVAQSIAIFQGLLNQNSDYSVAARDRLHLNLARAYFQNENFEKALEHYSKIKKSSDQWLDSVEERTWVYIRQNKFNLALADITTVQSPIFEKQISPESFYAKGYIHIKTCNFPAVVKNADKFKEIFKPRLIALENLASGKDQKIAETALAKLERGSFNISSYAKELGQVPRNFHLDSVIQDTIMKIRTLKAQAATGKEMEGLVGMKDTLISRIRQLAREEVMEIKVVLQKLQIIEADLIQRIHTAENDKKAKRPKIGEVKSSSETLTFNVDEEDEDIWIDEIDNYQATVKGCPEIGGKKL